MVVFVDLNRWRRHTIIRRISTSGVKGDILYFSPDGKKLKNIQEIIRVSSCTFPQTRSLIRLCCSI